MPGRCFKSQESMCLAVLFTKVAKKPLDSTFVIKSKDSLVSLIRKTGEGGKGYLGM
jgi:hypothetical protein